MTAIAILYLNQSFSSTNFFDAGLLRQLGSASKEKIMLACPWTLQPICPMIIVVVCAFFFSSYFPFGSSAIIAGGHNVPEGLNF